MLLARAAARAGAAVPRPRGCPARRPAPPAAATNDGPAHDVSLSRGARQSETSAVNLRAVAGRDAIDAAAGNLAKTLRGTPPPSPSTGAVILGADRSEDRWRELDDQFNEYPDQRMFKGIGTTGDDASAFAAAIVDAVASVVGPVDAAAVQTRESSGGKYVSVSVGPVTVQNGDEVVAVYAAMKERAGPALKWYI